MSTGEIESAARDAMTVWEEASPGLRFVYRGTTPEPPSQGDRIGGERDPADQQYKVTIAYGASVTHRRDSDGYIVEADVFWTPADPGDSLSHNRCDWHREGSCGNSRSGKLEILNVLVHELGHIVGLGDLADSDSRELTMYTHQSPGGSWGERFKVSLGYGDMLGIRHLYPCGCPLPRVILP